MDESPEHRIIRRRDITRRNLRVVADPPDRLELAPAPSARPRTIGRLIAQTALLADSAIAKKRTRVKEPVRNDAVPRSARRSWFF